MKTRHTSLEIEPVESLIHLIRGQRVILDADLARVYGVPTKRLNEAVKRTLERFPSDFAFLLKPQEVASLRSQIATSKGRGGRRYIPRAFTEYGAIMAANVLNSPRAVQMSVFVVRVPLCGMKMREVLGENRHLAGKLAELERRLTGRLDVHKKAIVYILNKIRGYARSHPGPLPQGEEERTTIPGKLGSEYCNHRGFDLCTKRANGIERVHIGRTRASVLPLLGERAGVRVGVHLIHHKTGFHARKAAGTKPPAIARKR
jgi:hypothetical protein